MVDFKNVASGDYVPASTGLVVGSGPVPMRVSFATLGNFGTGNPVMKLEVQRVTGGDWVPVIGATITDNGSKVALCYGVAVRVKVPTLTAPGTTTTAPRIVLHAQNLLVPNSVYPIATVGNHGYNVAGGSANYPSDAGLAGFGQLNPNIGTGPIVESRSVAFLTQIGDATSVIKGKYIDGDGDFWITESGSTAGASGQVCAESFAEAYRAGVTVSSDADELFLDVVKIPV